MAKARRRKIQYERCPIVLFTCCMGKDELVSHYVNSDHWVMGVTHRKCVRCGKVKRERK